MKRALKWLVGLGAVVVLLLVVAAIALPRLVDTPRVQAMIAGSASQAIGRPVKFESLSVALFPLPAVELHKLEVAEDHGPLLPISTYGASKLAGEALISSYCHMFGLTARVFRFGNVVGPRQTHGVGFDFLRQLLASPDRLTIQGDGTQSKSYIHVGDVVSAVLVALAVDRPAFGAASARGDG